MKSYKRKILITFGVLILAGAVSIYACNRLIENASAGKIYSNAEEIPANHVGLLLGTGKFLSSGHENPYYRYRINAAAALLKSGKIKYLVISGDNSRKNYDMDAIGFNAQDVEKNFGFRVQMREKLARVKVFVDIITGKKPKFLGETITIPSAN